MNNLQKAFYFFSRYTDPVERSVAKFFAGVSESDSPDKLARRLIDLAQNHLAVVNLLTERQYKGYDYLSKSTRRDLYENLEAIKQDFLRFAENDKPDINKLLGDIKSKGVDTSALSTRKPQLLHMASVMNYLSPKNGRYVYRASSSFGRLLRDPQYDKLEGDCNQIVTLYIVLFGLKFDVSDLKLTIYPGHVALHYCGIDIEATNATFVRYQKPGQQTAPLHEIVSVNLLDTTDINFSKSAVNPEVFLQAARLAYVVSSNRQLVKKNLEIAYQNTVAHLVSQDNYEQALKYARTSKDHELIESVAQRGAAYLIKHTDFSGARRMAGYSSRRIDLIDSADRAEAAHLYNLKQYQAAAKIYSRVSDVVMLANCYRALYLVEQSKLKGVKTASDLKNHAGVVRNLERYAKKSGDTALIKHAKSLSKHL